MDEKKEFEILLKKLEQKENKSKRYIAWLSFLPVLFALGLLYFTYTEITTAKDKLAIVEKEIEKSEKNIDTLRNRYQKLNELFEVYSWEPKSLSKYGDVDSIAVREAEKAHNEILRILDSNERVNYDVAIRYYAKRLDKNKVKNALRRMGYRDILFFSDSWEKNTSNRISFDKNVKLDEVKLIALTLLREGVQIKKISLYPEDIIIDRTKRNTIQIFGDSTLNHDTYLKYNDIISYYLK